MDKIKLYYANCTQIYSNTIYPNEVVLDDEKKLVDVFSHDYVCVKFKNNHRSNEDFIESNAVGVDFDNDHSENPNDWITSQSLEQIFTGVPFIIHYSKSHMKNKKGNKGITYGPRPRFHVIFPIELETSEPSYKELKEKLLKFCPLIDERAIDSAHFLAGTKNPQYEIHRGNVPLNKFIEEIYSEKAFEELDDVIKEGSRNATMHKIACHLLVRFGNCEESKQKYREASEKCVPPLEKDELNNIWKSAAKFYKNKVVTNPEYKAPEVYKVDIPIQWDEPLPFEKCELPTFPVECLPKAIRDYVLAVSEATQTPIDMAATASLSIMALCLQGRYTIQAKPDWIEPLNLYCLIIAEPSERKSAIVSLMTKVLIDYEIEFNQKHAGSFEFSKIAKQTLESKKKSFETQYMKGKKTKEEMLELANEIADFTEFLPKKLYVDDITTEKLTSVISDSGGKTGIISSEGGIFDVLSGMYSKNVNIDVFLKSYSGDSIRVDRIGRASELISNPCLTILLSVQPSVLTNFMDNATFEGKGLTTRFLYTIPTSFIGCRKYRTEEIPTEVKAAYEAKIRELLEEADDLAFDDVKLLLTPDAGDTLEAFFNENEKSMVSTNQEIKAWCGKIVGNVLRISGLLARMEGKKPIFIDPKMPVNQENVENAIKIGRYFIEHAKAAHSLMGIDPINKKCEYVLQKIKEKQISEFTKRDIVRSCRTFRSVEELTPIISRLNEYGYIQEKPSKTNQSPTYLVNPAVFTSSNSTTANN